MGEEGRFAFKVSGGSDQSYRGLGAHWLPPCNNVISPDFQRGHFLPLGYTPQFQAKIHFPREKIMDIALTLYRFVYPLGTRGPIFFLHL